MTKELDFDGLEAAQRLAALSPQTEAALISSVAVSRTRPDQVSQAFRAIGAAIARKREPISDANKKALFSFAERLITGGSHEVPNAVATCMLEAIWTALHESGFDFGQVDPCLGPASRRYLVAWDDFNETRTAGLTRR
jgi:hypothetical protein